MKLIIVCLVFAVLVVKLTESKPALQFLPPREGYVPVYIRLGDTPLREVNPDIDAAFHEDENIGRRIDEELMAADQPKDSDELLAIDSSEDKTEEIKEEVSEEKSDKSFESMESHEQQSKNRQRRQVDEAKKPAGDKKIPEKFTLDDNTSESIENESSEENKDKKNKPEEKLQQQATNRQ